MIVSSDISDIIYKDCSVFGIERGRFGNIPEGELVNERIVIFTKTLSTEDYWNDVFVNVNFCVPDKEGVAELSRLQELEREAWKRLKSRIGVFDGTRYRYGISSSSIEEDEKMKCHYVNVILKFEVLNVI